MMAAWTTHNEVEFIDYLGHHSTLSVSRLDLLRGYRAALDRRTDAGGLDLVQLRERCEAKIAAYQALR